MTWHKEALILAALASVGGAATAQEKDNEVNLSTQIIGNQEQPKVLYIVPWKAVNPAALGETGFESQLELVFGHLEPNELRRELRYLKELGKLSKQN